MATTNELLKQASQSIRTLVKERDDLVDLNERVKTASEIVKTMIDREMLASEEILPKLADLQEKDAEELLIIKKALELGSGNISKLGELSDERDLEAMSASELFLHRQLGDLL